MATTNNNDDNDMTVLLQTDRLPRPSEALASLWLPSSSPSLHGSKSMVSFENTGSDVSFMQAAPAARKEENEEEEEYNDGAFLQSPGKKRRLTAKQVEFLEKSFEVENKLEPERKVQLATELELQPRQVAIWFQNRRARFKTKQLEKDFGLLRATYDSLKSDYDDLLKHNQALKLEVNSLKEKLVRKEKGKSESSVEEGKKAIVVPKQEEASSAKSDVFDADESPHCAENNYSSSQAFDQSDFSQDEEDDFIISKSAGFLAPSPFLPKLQDCCYADLPESSCHLGFALEDHHFNFWPY